MILKFIILKVDGNPLDLINLKIGLDFGNLIHYCCVIDYNKIRYDRNEMIYRPNVRFYFVEDIIFMQLENAVKFYSKIFDE